MERAVHPCFEEAVRATGGAELTTHDVGLAILGPLQELDLVAYLRFASVYRAFDSLEDFEAAIAELRERWPPVRRCTGTCLSWPQVGIPSSLAQRQRCPLLAPGGGGENIPTRKSDALHKLPLRGGRNCRWSDVKGTERKSRPLESPERL